MPGSDRASRKYYWLFGLGIVLAILLIFSEEWRPQDAETTAVGKQTDLAAEERQVKYLLEEMENVEEVSVMLKTDETGKISGIAVICRAGEDPVVQEKIIRLLRALFGLGSHQISVSG